MKKFKLAISIILAAVFCLSISAAAGTQFEQVSAETSVAARPVYATKVVQDLQDTLHKRLQTFHNDFDGAYLNRGVWTDPIAGEKPHEQQQIMFHGAWYYNNESAMDSWMGIDAVITLPEVRQDDDRVNENGGRYLDNPSMYMGVTGIKESDVGLTWERMCEDTDEVNPSISTQGMGFRPFWRFINASGNNTYFNADKFYYQTYFFPGDTVRMALLGTSSEKCVLYVKLIKPTTIPKYAAFRARLNIREEFEFVTEEFEAPGLLSQDIAFKVINAIDQANNEGKPTKKTRTTVLGAVWHNTYLYRKIDNNVYKVPFNAERTGVMGAPRISGFVVNRSHPLNATTGYRTVDIIPFFAIDYNPA